MAVPGEVISHHQMCATEARNLQRGMNFGRNGTRSVVLMSVRPNAPYADRVEDAGRTLIYEGHDVPRTRDGPDPKTVDQDSATPAGRRTENGLFVDAADAYRRGEREAELVRVYEKVRSGIWVFNGSFQLVDAWQEPSNGRSVFKFKLQLDEAASNQAQQTTSDLEPTRVIPSAVKLEVWKRDGGRCVQCGATDNLHFDHVIPYSRGGSSLVADNVQLLCARHNLAKHDSIG